jgi:hypothetical protein
VRGGGEWAHVRGVLRVSCLSASQVHHGLYTKLREEGVCGAGGGGVRQMSATVQLHVRGVSWQSRHRHSDVCQRALAIQTCPCTLYYSCSASP